MEAYGFELRDPSEGDMALYERFVRLLRIAGVCMSARYDGTVVEL